MSVTIPGLRDGTGLEHDINFSQVAGLRTRLGLKAQSINMAGANVTLQMSGTTGTIVTGNLQFITPGAGTPQLRLPPEADWRGPLLIANVAGAAQSFTVRDDSGATTVLTLDQGRLGVVICDGTNIRGVTGPADFNDFGAGGLLTDVIGESTAGAGVTIDGALVIDGFFRALAGTAAAPSHSFSADTNTGLYSAAADQIGVGLAGLADFLFLANIFRALAGSVIETDTINETTVGAGVTIDGVLVRDGGVTLTANLVVGGRIIATGTSALVDAEHIDLRANYLQQNLDYVTAAAQTGGLVVNYLPTATVDTTVGAGVVTAGVDAVSDPTITTAGAAVFAAADIVMISGSANSGENDGLYEVVSHAANVLTLRSTSSGITNRVEDFTLDQLVANAGDVGMALTKVTVSVARCGTDGRWEVGAGAVTPIAYRDIFDGSGTATHADGSIDQYLGSGTGTGDVLARWGGTATEGLELRVYEATVSPAAVETNLINTPARSVIVAVQANCQTALTGGGTTVTWSIGIAADPDKYGTAGDGAGDTLLLNGKLNFFPAWALLTAAEQMVLTGCAAGGAADGDTALTVGSVRVRVYYYTLNALDDA